MVGVLTVVVNGGAAGVSVCGSVGEVFLSPQFDALMYQSLSSPEWLSA